LDLPAPGSVLASPSDSLAPLGTGPAPPAFQRHGPAGRRHQFSKIPLKTTTFTGVLRATEFPTQSGEFGTWKVRATPTTKPAIKRRSAA